MVRSLLPRGLPDVRGLEVGAVYESSARVEVGGDVYDFLTLPDGQLAVVLGDARGHGIEATADMALAKFAFRSLVRLYPESGRAPGPGERGRARRARRREFRDDALRDDPSGIGRGLRRERGPPTRRACLPRTGR